MNYGKKRKKKETVQQENPNMKFVEKDNKFRTILPCIKKIGIPAIVISVILSIALIWLVRNITFMSTWMGLIADATPTWYTGAYYNTVNTKYVHEEEFPDIVILNLTKNRTRQDIADLLEILSEASPKAVGVDVTFSTSKRFDSIQTMNLLHTIESVQNKASFPIVYASVLGEKSIIPDSLAEKLNIGCVNFSGYYEYKKEINGVPHFAALLASLAQYDISNLDMASFLINYRKKAFNDGFYVEKDFREGDEPDRIANLVKNKIVLIGGTDHRTDMHATPFIIDNKIDNDKEEFAGTIEISYTLSSLICSTYTKDDWKKIKNKEIFHPYSKGKWWVNVIINILFIGVYLILYVIIDIFKETCKILELLKPILLLLAVLLSVVISMIITANFYYVPDVVWLMVMTAFIGSSYDACKLILNK